MDVGKTIGTAFISFIITNIDDIFVLVTFFSESSTEKSTITSLQIVIGQTIGYIILIAISLIGYGVAFAIPTEPIGFLGLLPICIGISQLIDLIYDKIYNKKEDEEEDVLFRSNKEKFKNIIKIFSITISNGADNISIYIPLFSQANSIQLGIYIVVFLFMLGIWCLIGYLFVKQKYILKILQKYVHYVLPFLFIGLGIYIIVNSECYTWSIDKINISTSSNTGLIIIPIITSILLIIFIILTLLFKYFQIRKKKKEEQNENDENNIIS